MEVSDYEYLDKYPYENITYYRLQQVDFDGQFEYSDIVSIENRTSELGSEAFGLRLYPNPVQNTLNIENGEGQAIIYNSIGQPLRTVQISNTTFQIELNDLPKGVYMIRFYKIDSSVVSKQFVKM